MDTNAILDDKSKVFAVVTLARDAASDAAPAAVKLAAAVATPYTAAATPNHTVAQSMLDGYCRVVTLQSGGPQHTSFGIGPGERKGDRPRARRIYQAARARGLEGPELDFVSPYEQDSPSSRSSASTDTISSAGEARAPASPRELAGYRRVVSLQVGGSQAVSWGIGPGECKGDKPKARLVSEAAQEGVRH